MTLTRNVGLESEQLALNRQALVDMLTEELAGFEASYGFPSSELGSRLAAGEIEETVEICDWYIAWESYSAAVDGRPPRLE